MDLTKCIFDNLGIYNLEFEIFLQLALDDCKYIILTHDEVIFAFVF